MAATTQSAVSLREREQGAAAHKGWEANLATGGELRVRLRTSCRRLSSSTSRSSRRSIYLAATAGTDKAIALDSQSALLNSKLRIEFRQCRVDLWRHRHFVLSNP